MSAPEVDLVDAIEAAEHALLEHVGYPLASAARFAVVDRRECWWRVDDDDRLIYGLTRDEVRDEDGDYYTGEVLGKFGPLARDLGVFRGPKYSAVVHDPQVFTGNETAIFRTDREVK